MLKKYEFFNKDGDPVGKTCDRIEALAFKNAHSDYTMEVNDTEDPVHSDLPKQTQ